MAFLAPLAALVGLLAIPILLLYMLRLRRREVQVSSVMLWQMILRDREANAPWQRLRRNLLLFLQLMILAALVLAIMRPYLQVPAITRGRIALLIDASASMTSTDVAPNRFTEAINRAREIVDTMASGNTVGIIRVGSTPELVVSYTGDQDQLRTALEALQPEIASADWEAALTLAAAGGQGAEEFTVVAITDGGLPANLRLDTFGTLRFIEVGQSAENRAISALAIDDDPTKGVQLYARLANYGPTNAETILSIYLDDQLFTARSYTVPANAAIDVVLEGLPAEFRRVRAQLTQPSQNAVPDYLSADDVAWAVYTPASAGQAVIMSRGNVFLEQGFASIPDWRVFRSNPAQGLPSSPYDLYVFDAWLPASLPDGNILIVNPPAGVPTAYLQVINTVRVENPAAQTSSVRPDDPRTLYVQWDEVNIFGYKQLSNIGWATPLVSISNATGGSDPLVLAGEYEGRRIVILPFDLLDSDLPLKITYPILLANLTNWYKAPRALAFDGALRPSQTAPIKLVGNADAIVITKPDGTSQRFTPEQGAIIFSDTETSGIYEVALQSGETTTQQERFAVNLFDPSEENIAPKPLTPGGDVTANTPAQQEIGQLELWHWLTLAALAVLALEWFVYHRQFNVQRVKGSIFARAPKAARK
jgi:Ca-activated chloride channel homolog